MCQPVIVESMPVGIVPDDPSDDMIVATALAGRADVICTRDRHLHHPEVRAWCADRGIRILNDIELLELLQQNPAGDGTRYGLDGDKGVFVDSDFRDVAAGFLDVGDGGTNRGR